MSVPEPSIANGSSAPDENTDNNNIVNNSPSPSPILAAEQTNQTEAGVSSEVFTPEIEQDYINNKSLDRKSFYFLKENSDVLQDEQRVKEIAKRYNYLLDLSVLFKKFFQAKAEKDPKFGQIIKRIEEQDHKAILSSNNGKKHSEANGHEGARRRKTEKEEDAELLNADSDSDIIEFTESPTYINGKLREYQVQGLNWLVSLHENNLSGILADEMGLGKTLQTISFLGYLRFFKNTVGPHLVIVPKSTLENWQREFNKWIPQFKAIVLTGDKEQRSNIINNEIMECNFDVVISSYEIVIKEKATLRKFDWSYLAIDEAHRIKNEQSLLSQVIRLFTSKNRLLITGTPLQNNLHELWALLNFLLPDVFSDSEGFDEYFGSSTSTSDKEESKESDDHQQEVIKQLHTILSPFLLRRIKSQVEKSLLPKKELNLYVNLSPLQKNLYRKLLEKDLDAINGLNGKKESKTRLLNIVMQLRKCCNHPYLFDGVEPGPPYTTDEHLVYNSQKLKILDRLLKKFKAEGSRVLIFSQMSRMLDIMEDYCYFRKYNYCRIDGSTEHEDRIQQIDDYNAEGSDKFVFLLTTRAGGLGINLTSADVVILFDSDWNPQADLQAMDRAHRIGQKKQVKVFRLVTENSIEEKVLERAMKKLRLDQVVIQQVRSAPSANNKNVDKDELLNMIRHGAQDIFDAGGTRDSSEAPQGEDSGEFDLEEILANSEKRTKELNSKYSKLGFDELQEMDNDNTSAYQWNGTDFKKKQTRKVGSGFMWLNPGKRERKENYSIDAYYRDALHTGGRTASSEPKAPRPPKSINLYDHQFYSPHLYELYEKEKNWYKKSINYKVPPGGEKGNSSNKLFTSEDLETDAKLEQFEIDHAEPLTVEEEKLKTKYLEEGFGNWSRREFNNFIQLSAKYGRRSISAISKEMVENSVVMNVKTVEEIEKYAKVFWERFEEIEGFEKYLAQIEQGEEKIAKHMKQQKCLHKKMAQYEVPLKELELKFPPASLAKAAFTPDEDAFLLVQLFKHGIDAENLYDTIHKEILKSSMFKFDYFLKTRSNPELSRRCHTLLASIVKEIDAEEKKLKSTIERKKKNLDEKIVEATEKKKKKAVKAKNKAKANGVKKGKATGTNKAKANSKAKAAVTAKTKATGKAANAIAVAATPKKAGRGRSKATPVAKKGKGKAKTSGKGVTKPGPKGRKSASSGQDIAKYFNGKKK